MTLRIGYLLPTRESIMEGRPEAEAVAEWLNGYVEQGARYLVLRFAGDHERHLEVFAKLREALTP